MFTLGSSPFSCDGCSTTALYGTSFSFKLSQSVLELELTLLFVLVVGVESFTLVPLLPSFVCSSTIDTSEIPMTILGFGALRSSSALLCSLLARVEAELYKSFETVSLIDARRFRVFKMGDGLSDFEWWMDVGVGDVGGIEGMSLVERFFSFFDCNSSCKFF